LKTGGFAIIAAASLLAGCNNNEGEKVAPQPDKTVQQLMAQDVQPTAEIYWDAVQYISDETGDHDIVPETDEDWDRARQAAKKLQEYGRLLATPAYASERGNDWMDFANALVEVGERAEQTTVDKDVDAVFEVGGVVYRVCSGCHTFYPPANPIGAEPADAEVG